MKHIVNRSCRINVPALLLAVLMIAAGAGDIHGQLKRPVPLKKKPVIHRTDTADTVRPMPVADDTPIDPGSADSVHTADTSDSLKGKSRQSGVQDKKQKERESRWPLSKERKPKRTF
jgi:hypothetical protein